MKSSGHASGVVLSSKPMRDDKNYLTEVRLDGSGKTVTVRFPQEKRIGAAVKLTGQH